MPIFDCRILCPDYIYPIIKYGFIFKTNLEFLYEISNHFAVLLPFDPREADDVYGYLSGKRCDPYHKGGRGRALVLLCINLYIVKKIIAANGS